MWQRFTERTRRIVFDAQIEARARHAPMVATEHLLLALLKSPDSVACNILNRMRVDLSSLSVALMAREEMEIGNGESPVETPLTTGAKRSVDLAYDEARRLGNNYIGTEHLLVGLIRQESGLASRALASAGVELELVRRIVSDIHEEALRQSADAGVAPQKAPPARPLWKRFTENARRAVFVAQEEAARLGEEYVSTEHLLLGLLHTEESRAAGILRRFDPSLNEIRATIVAQLVRGDYRGGSKLQLSPRAKRVIDLAADEALRLDDDFIGTEHLLLGLVREEQGLGGRILIQMGFKLPSLRDIVKEQTAGSRPPKESRASRLEDDLEILRRRLKDIEDRKSIALPPALARAASAAPAIGDLGCAVEENSVYVEAARDAAAFGRLIAIFAARDSLGYKAMLDGDQTLFLLEPGTRLKLLVFPPDTSNVQNDGCYVRILSGDRVGDACWIFKRTFERTGPDDAEFPPR